MPQGPFQTSAVPSLGGSTPTYDVSAAALIKAGPGRLAQIIVQVVGSAGNFTLNDSATVAGAGAANQIAEVAYNATGLVAGTPITFNWPFVNGLVVSAVTTGGSLAVSVD